MRRMPGRKVAEDIKNLFPIGYDENNLCSLLKISQAVLKKKVEKVDGPRILDAQGKDIKDLIKEFSVFPECGDRPDSVCTRIVSNFFVNIPRWRHPQLQYNVGAPVNTASCAMYSLALDENIYNINDGLAGNSLYVEQIIANILSNLAGLSSRGIGFFTFGGTATNYYATKIGLKKVAPDSGKAGIPKNLRVFVTEDAHFSHIVSADWLGIGTDSVVTIKAGKNRQSNVHDAEDKMRKELDEGNLISSIILNGGTTYGHTIDDILSFVKLRDKLVKEYSLAYVPHIHVDSVIGWAWLVFRGYDFDKNELGISQAALLSIKKQCEKISQVKYVDSWGVDFHKGIGCCPIDCSIVMINDIKDINLISKKENSRIDMHQITPEFSLSSPADYTLETSRSAGPSLAALAALNTLGKRGFRRNLANLVEQSILMRELFSSFDDMAVCNKDDSHGFVTMVRLYPPELKDDKRRFKEFTDNSEKGRVFVSDVNRYMKEFFTWDNNSRMSKGIGVEYSFSSGYMKLGNGSDVSGIKLYPVSPHFNRKYAKQAVNDIVRQKKYFDKNIWKKG
jgi:glutamate/tyrosine decarboxylase-like PLP-dependent enzyme